MLPPRLRHAAARQHREGARRHRRADGGRQRRAARATSRRSSTRDVRPAPAPRTVRGPARRSATTSPSIRRSASPAAPATATACCSTSAIRRIPMRIAAVADSNFSYWHSATFNNDGTQGALLRRVGRRRRSRSAARPTRRSGAPTRSSRSGTARCTSRATTSCPRRRRAQENCVAHNGSLIPIPGRDVMVQAWYQGGISVFDWTDAAHPQRDRLLRSRPGRLDAHGDRRLVVGVLVQRRDRQLRDRARPRHLRADAERVHLAERDRRGEDGAPRLPEHAGPAEVRLAGELRAGARVRRSARALATASPPAGSPRCATALASAEKRVGLGAEPALTAARRRSSTATPAARATRPRCACSPRRCATWRSNDSPLTEQGRGRNVPPAPLSFFPRPFPAMKSLLPFVLLGALVAPVRAQQVTLPLPIDLTRSAEARWMRKPIRERRTLDDMSRPATWEFHGSGTMAFDTLRTPSVMPMLHVNVTMFPHGDAPARNHLSAVNLRRAFAGEDWSGYNRLSLRIRPKLRGFPMLPLEIVLHNDGVVKVPDVYDREGVHYVTLRDGEWQQVVWEITPLARDRVTSLEIGYWVNKQFAAAGDTVAFEIADLELQRVEPDNYEGWSVSPGRIAFSNSGYLAGGSKSAIASDLAAREFTLLRLDASGAEHAALTAPVTSISTRLGTLPAARLLRHPTAGSVRHPGGQSSHATVRHRGRRLAQHGTPDDQLLLRRTVRVRRARLSRRGACRLARHPRRQPDRDERRLARCRRFLAGPRQHGRGDVRHVRARRAAPASGQRSRAASPADR